MSTSGGTFDQDVKCCSVSSLFLFAVLLWTQLAGQLVDLWHKYFQSESILKVLWREEPL